MNRAWLLILSLSLGGVGCNANDESGGDFSDGGEVDGSPPDGVNQPETSEAGSVDAASLEECPEFLSGAQLGTLESPEVTEASGIVASRKNPGVLWVHNDSGDEPRLFALDLQGNHLGIWELPEAVAFDWEDMAAGPGPAPQESYLFVGDIGDNLEFRDRVTIYRFSEPTVEVGENEVTESIIDFATIELRYPNDQAHNAETLLVDPTNGDLLIVTKKDDGPSEVYRAQGPHSTDDVQTMELIASLDFGNEPLSGSRLTTAGDISPDGRFVLIRTYSSVYLWRRPPGWTWVEAFATEACPMPVKEEPQGEAIGFAADGSGYFTVSENQFPPLYRFERIP